METRMKLSELTYEFLESIGLPRTHMPTDCSDSVTLIDNPERFERAKKELAERYGDVELVIDPAQAWFNQIRIEDEKWKADHERYCKAKGEWCRKYGCD